MPIHAKPVSAGAGAALDRKTDTVMVMVMVMVRLTSKIIIRTTRIKMEVRMAGRFIAISPIGTNDIQQHQTN